MLGATAHSATDVAHEIFARFTWKLGTRYDRSRLTAISFPLPF